MDRARSGYGLRACAVTLDPIPDPLAAAEKAVARLNGRPKRNREQRRSRDGSEVGSHKHPAGATKAFPSERKTARQRRRRSR